MYREHLIHTIAGTFILISIALSQFFSPYWLFFTAFVGLNLFQHGFSRWCLLDKVLAKAGVHSYADRRI